MVKNNLLIYEKILFFEMVSVYYIIFNSSNNRNYGSEKKSFGMSLLDGKGNEYGLYKEIEKEIILSGINSEFDIKKFIELTLELKK